jgi:hypothetical protein
MNNDENSTGSTRYIVFLEQVGEAESLLSYVEEQGWSVDPILIVTLSIEVQLFLRRKGVRFSDTVEFFGREDHARVLTHQAEFTQEFESILDLRVEGEIVRDTYQDSAVFFVQYYLGYFLFVSTVVHNAITKYQPSGVICFSASDRPESQVRDCTPDARNHTEQARIHVREDEALANRIVENYAANLGIQVIRASLAVSTNPYFSSTTSGSRVSRESTRLWHRVLRRAYKWIAKRQRSKHLVLFSGGGGTNGSAVIAAIRTCRSVHTLVLEYEPLTLRGLISTAIRSIGSWSPHIAIPVDVYDASESTSSIDHLALLRNRLESAFRENPDKKFVFLGVDFFSIFSQKVCEELFSFLANSMGVKIAKELEAVRHLQPRQVVSTGARLSGFALGEWARWRGVDFIMVSHGTAIAPKNDLEEIENRRLGRSLLLSEVVSVGMLQSKIEEAHVKHYLPSCRTVATGPIVFADLDRRGKRRPRGKTVGRPVITVASSFKTNGTLSFWAMETPDEYLHSCRDIVSAVNEMNRDVSLCIRFHAKLSMSPDDFRDLLPSSPRLSIDRGGRFLDCLRRSDLIVNFASTSIEESLQNRVPVLLYDRWQRYRHCDASIIDDPKQVDTAAVYYLDRSPDLSATLTSIVDKIDAIRKAPELFDHYCYPDSYLSNFTDIIAEASKSSGGSR